MELIKNKIYRCQISDYTAVSYTHLDVYKRQVFYRVSWIDGGIAYSIQTFDPGSLTMDDFFQMAQEVIEA